MAKKTTSKKTTKTTDAKRVKRLDKQARGSEKQLTAVRAELAGTQQKLARAEARAERWKKEAKGLRTTQPAAVDEPAAPNEPTGPVPAARAADESWTVVQLRSEARARGLTGMSRKSKAELVAALS